VKAKVEKLMSTPRNTLNTRKEIRSDSPSAYFEYFAVKQAWQTHGCGRYDVVDGVDFHWVQPEILRQACLRATHRQANALQDFVQSIAPGHLLKVGVVV
jgi:hypothetical protein